MVQSYYKILGICLAVGLIIPLQSSHGKNQPEVPVPHHKPTPQDQDKIVPKPYEKPDFLSQGIQPNGKKMVVEPDGQVQVVDHDDLTPIARISPDKQARLIREIFEMQSQGNIQEANYRLNHLKSTLLRGHILAERYLKPNLYDVSYEELEEWIRLYSDHPQALKIYALAKNKFPKKSVGLIRPNKQRQISGNITVKSQRALQYKTSKRRNADQQNRVEKLYREIKSKTRQSKASLSLNILNNDYATQFIDDVEYDELRALIAASYFYALKKDDAYRLASKSFERSGNFIPLSGWIKGLIDWEAGRFDRAAIAFETASSSRYASGWLSSAAAFWASRSYKKAGDHDRARSALSLAAAYPRTFYGLIATRALGNNNHFNWKIPALSREDIKEIEKTPKGLRASSLIQAGQIGLAEAELKTLAVDNNIPLKKSLLSYAHHYKLPSLLMLMGNALSAERGNYYDAALYPQAEWITSIDFNVDSALINAFVRQESRFNQFASNPSGATGLMQLMPITANHVVGQDLYNTAAGRYTLMQPDKNLDVGQRYIQELLSHPAVNNNVMHLAVAYNAGPGNLRKWKRERSHIKDPLLFIETIPFTETRAFVERIMANYWIYKMREGEKNPTLDALASGEWAQYASN